MTDFHSLEWHEERRKGIGGSDWSDVLSLEPYGCARRLVFIKRGKEPDFPIIQTPVMLRGHLLEPIIAQEYAEETQSSVGAGPAEEKDRLFDLPDWWTGNVDRIIYPTKNVMTEFVPEIDVGVLEIKTKAQRMYFKAKKEGLALGEYAQIHHYMYMLSLKWGDFIVKWPDGWQHFIVRVEKDEELISRMLSAGEVFWKKVTDGPLPHRLDPGDRRCQNCNWRQRCHGLGLYDAVPDEPAGDYEVSHDRSLLNMVNERAEIRTVVKQSKEMMEGINEQIKTHLGKPSKLIVQETKVLLYETIPTRFDSRNFKTDHPEMYKKYTKIQKKQETLRIYPPKD